MNYGLVESGVPQVLSALLVVKILRALLSKGQRFALPFRHPQDDQCNDNGRQNEKVDKIRHGVA